MFAPKTVSLNTVTSCPVVTQNKKISLINSLQKLCFLTFLYTGVEVRIVCRFKAASSTTTETITFSANRTTNEFGLYKVAISSLDCADVDSLASSSQASLIGRKNFSDSSCNIPGYRTTTDQVLFKSQQSNSCVYGFNALNFRPFKRDLALCGKK